MYHGTGCKDTTKITFSALFFLLFSYFRYFPCSHTSPILWSLTSCFLLTRHSPRALWVAAAALSRHCWASCLAGSRLVPLHHPADAFQNSQKHLFRSTKIAFLQKFTETSFRVSPPASDFRFCRGLFRGTFCNFVAQIPLVPHSLYVKLSKNSKDYGEPDITYQLAGCAEQRPLGIPMGDACSARTSTAFKPPRFQESGASHAELYN